MNLIFNSKSEPLIRKLESIFPLSDEEKGALLSLPIQEADLKADQDIVREGDRPGRCFVVLEGVTCSYKKAGSGKRQITAFHIAGDMPDLHSLHLEVLDFSVGTLTPCKVGFIRHDHVRALCAAHPRIASAFWRDTLIDGAIFREWLVNVGRRDAYSRIAHIMSEIFVKFRAVGLSVDHTVEFPITQSEIGDALGLSNVHVSRSIKELRESGLIRWEKNTLTILDWDGLREAGDFDPTYLHFRDEQIAA